MSTTTTNLGLNKTDTTSDGQGSFVDKNEFFNFDTDLNDNWDKIDSTIGKLSDLETTEKNSLVGAINEVSESVPDVSDLANKDLSNLSTTGNAKFANKDLSNLSTTGEAKFVKSSVAVTHTAGTAVGSSTRPTYVNSSGIATACSGLDTDNLCRNTIPTSSAGATTTKPAVVIESRYDSSAHTCYRLWSDKFLEQGGGMVAFQQNVSGLSNTTQITLLKPYGHKNYMVEVEHEYDGTPSTAAAYDYTVNTVTSTSFRTYTSSGKHYLSWYAAGYVS